MMKQAKTALNILPQKLTFTIGKCVLKPLLKETRPKVYQMTFGFVQGLYKSENYPKNVPCVKCKAFALPVANMQNGIALMMELA